jgi:hypothetical protein
MATCLVTSEKISVSRRCALNQRCIGGAPELEQRRYRDATFRFRRPVRSFDSTRAERPKVL